LGKKKSIRSNKQHQPSVNTRKVVVNSVDALDLVVIVVVKSVVSTDKNELFKQESLAKNARIMD
jgi:hypothetical protein